MKQILKKGLSLLLAITIIFGSAVVGLGELDFSGLFAVKANAAITGNFGESLIWTLDDGTLTISGTGSMGNYNSNYNAPWYNYASRVKAVVIKSGVTKIGNRAFSDCINLTSITIPDSVTSIGDYAFSQCESLTSVTIPDSVTSIGEDAFYYCTSLTTVTIPDSVTSIGSHTFWVCTSLTSVIIPDSVTSIGDSAFDGCTSLTSITIPDSVTSIGSRAFEGCTSLTGVTIPDSVTSIGVDVFCDTAYYNNESNWENGVLYIGNHLIAANRIRYVDGTYVYIGNVSGDYVIKSGTITIAARAFDSCTSLTGITIPDSVTSIGKYAFSQCEGLVSVTIGDSVTTIGESAFQYCKSLTSLTIGEGVTSIGERAFWSCESLTSVTIPDGVTSIGGGAFSYCIGLQKINWNAKNVTSESGIFDSAGTAGSGIELVFGGTVEKIPEYLCYVLDSSYSPRIISVIISGSVTSIGSCAFYNCASLTSIAISDSVTSIGDQAFYNTAYYNNSTNWKNGALYIGNHLIKTKDSLSGSYEIKPGTKTIAERAFYYCDSLTGITIPDGITSIGVNAFTGCHSLTGITIPDSVKNIGYGAFGDCTNLTSVTIPGSVTSIGGYAFSFCDRLTSVTIGNGVKSIGDYAFLYCTRLISVILPDSVTSIGAGAFNYCDALAFVFFTGNKAEWAEISRGEYNESLTSAKIHYNATGHTSSDWIIDGKATVNGEGWKHKECTQCGIYFEHESIPQLKCTKPSISKIENKDYGVRFEWKKVEGADSYKVYRKVSGGSYKLLGTTTKTAYADKTAKSGTKYYYVVKATNEVGDSEKSASKGITFVGTPTIKTIANASTGVKLSWGKVSGAEAYKVYRKTSSGSYAYIGKATGTSYTDKTAKSGTKYYYVVKAVKDSYVSAKSEAKSITFLSAPKISGASSGKAGITVKWSKVSGAEGYIVYRKAPSGDWKKLAKVKGNAKIKYLDEFSKKDVTYQYKVKAYKGSSTSESSSAYKIKSKY